MENNENLHDKEKGHGKDMSMMDIMLKQQALLLQQFEALSKEREKAREREDEIDLTKLVPRFMKKKKNEVVESRQGQPSEFEVIETNELNKVAQSIEERERLRDKMLSYSKRKGKKFFWISIEYINLVWKFKYIPIIMGFIGLAYGLYIYFTADKQYTSEMTVSKGKLSNTFYFSLIENLQSIVSQDGYEQLAQKVNISVEEAKYITKIEYKDYLYLDEAELEKQINDSTIEKLENPFFKVSASVTNVDVLAKLEKGIYNYIQNNPYVVRDRQVRKLILTNKIEKFNKEIIGMDSLKYAVIGRIQKTEDNNYFVKPSGLDAGSNGGIILSQDDKLEIDPLLPFQQTMQMANQRDELEEELIQLEEEFSIVTGFSESSSPSFPNKRFVVYLMLIFGFVGGLAALLLAGIKLNNLRAEEA